MKKSVVILIGIIYIASIALVSFFGLEFKTFEEIVYVEEIEILNTDVKTDSMGKYVVIFPDENGNRTYKIEYRVHPDNATDQGVTFSYDAQNAGVSVDQNGVVTFTGPGAVTITLIPKDGSVVETSLTIISY